MLPISVDMFKTITDGLGFLPVDGTVQWWWGFERDDAAMWWWCYVGPDRDECEVAVMANDAFEFARLLHVLIDNLDLYRCR